MSESEELKEEAKAEERPRRTSKPFLFVALLKSVWTSHPKNVGRVYGGTSRDLKEAKDWLEVNPEFEFEDVTEITERFDRFMKSEFWEEQDWPIWGFLKFYARYASPRIVVKNPRGAMIECGSCGMNHGTLEPCRTLRLAK